jgi:nucleoside 2-deoxyribosyltransferase
MKSKRGLIYIAGGLFTSSERSYLEKLDKICRLLGFDTYLPHREAGLFRVDTFDAQKIFKEDVAPLNKAKLLVAVIGGPDLESGTAWEIGYAYAHGVPVFCIVDDIRINDPERLNVMISGSTKVYFSLKELTDGIKKIK